MNNPVLVEVLRGALVESRHTGAVAAVDADGHDVLALGDIRHPVFPRSAIKAIQALPLVESGAADGYGFGSEELALARGGGAATAVHNNCSGKHAGFLCIACATGADPARYVQPSHPVQRMVRD